MLTRLAQQLAFLAEVDKVKSILRRNYLCDGSRTENDAEHMWHLALMATVLVEHANPPAPDLLRTLKMLLIHDLVEIDAGDTFAYDAPAHHDKYEREQRAAERIFGMLPADQTREFRDLWEEFEARQSPEARFANALDRIAPILLNCRSGGISYKQHQITRAMIIRRNRDIVHEGSLPVWVEIEAILAEGEAQGIFGVREES